eukprot:10346108-Karenia_brevis.AAC.1
MGDIAQMPSETYQDLDNKVACWTGLIRDKAFQIFGKEKNHARKRWISDASWRFVRWIPSVRRKIWEARMTHRRWMCSCLLHAWHAVTQSGQNG